MSEISWMTDAIRKLGHDRHFSLQSADVATPRDAEDDPATRSVLDEPRVVRIARNALRSRNRLELRRDTRVLQPLPDVRHW